jgi:hypothetical protein
MTEERTPKLVPNSGRGVLPRGALGGNFTGISPADECSPGLASPQAMSKRRPSLIVKRGRELWDPPFSCLGKNTLLQKILHEPQLQLRRFPIMNLKSKQYCF